MAEHSRVVNLSATAISLPATYGSKLIAPGSSEIIADTNANVIAALGGARAIAGVARVEFVPDSVPATVAVAAVPANVTAAIAAAVDGLAPIDSPTFTGTPAAPTPDPGDDTTKVATTEFVTEAVATAIAGIPEPATSVIRYAVPMQWYRSQPAQGLVEDTMGSRPGGPGGFVWRAPRGGSIVGISANLASAITVGSLTFNVWAPGKAGLELVCAPGPNADGGAVVQAAGLDTYLAKTQISVTLSTSADMDPSGAGQSVAEVFVFVEEAVAET